MFGKNNTHVYTTINQKIQDFTSIVKKGSIMAEKQETTGTKSFKDTLNLPRTDFPIRPNSRIDDPAMIERWEREHLYRTTFEAHAGSEKFILHDGPPYANGHIHLGHAYNKILKDIVAKSQRMLGKHVPVIPGWDCHGLPIEKKVSDENPGLTPVELKAACRAYALHWVQAQKQEFKRLGVLMDWERPYLTMKPAYEAAIMRAFGAFVAQGYIERKDKTVPWCASCKTVLASAEIEYHDRKDPSVYVLFKLDPAAVASLLPTLAGREINLLVWTTTPWTLPLNRAVALRPDASYVVLDCKGTYILVARELAERVCKLLDQPVQIMAHLASNDIAKQGATVEHPFVPGLSVPVLLNPEVSLEDGTACVHQAPGCGPEDYEFGIKNNLEIFSPISPDGRYSKGIMPEELEGMSVTDGQIWVIKKLAATNRLFFKANINHSYPHCWRCRQGLIFRATRQWFCNLSQGALRSKALAEIDTIAMIPGNTANRLKAAIDGRLEWCLSRQRAWGVPIPALLCVACNHAYSTPELIEKVAHGVEQHGIEYWDTVTIDTLVPEGLACSRCSSHEFVKERDILDVWFDSGISHAAVLRPRDEFPADIYLEGKDQHRGWFQSSLLTSVVLEGRAPMKTIVTHGFTVDELGRKMSKSLNNGVAPEEMIEQLGSDGLRLWAASIDCSGEAVVSEILLTNVKEVFRKVRNTCRFLLSNLYDFDYEKDAIPVDQMLEIDRYALQALHELQEDILKNYKAYEFTAVSHALADYCSTELSAFYLDIIKDRLYVEQRDGLLRRSAQTACWRILDTLTRLIAPIMSFTAEQLSDHYQKNKTQSIHLQCFAPSESIWHGAVVPQATVLQDDKLLPAQRYMHQWQPLKQIRSAVFKVTEPLREQGIIKHPLEARVIVHFDAELRAGLASLLADIDASAQGLSLFLKEFFIASEVVITVTPDDLEKTNVKGFFVRVERAQGDKCPRCWQWEVTTRPDKLCKRCAIIVVE